MELPSRNDTHFSSVEEKLHYEIRVLKTAMAKIERSGDSPAEQWLYPIYERILTRRTRLLSRLSA